jgi:hypothetical protein
VSGILALNAQKRHADESPVAPASLPSYTPEQGPNPFEAMGTLSDVGELGFLFNHDPHEWVPTHLEETSPAPQTEISQEALLAINENDVQTPQADPHYATTTAPHEVGGTNLADTLRKEVSSFRGSIQSLFTGGSNG